MGQGDNCAAVDGAVHGQYQVDDGMARLIAVGRCLEQGGSPLVFNGGVVEPGGVPALPFPGEERRSDDDEVRRARGTTGVGARTAGRQATRGPGAASAATPIFGSRPVGRLTGELAGVETSYPAVSVRTTPDSTLLVNLIKPIRGLPDTAYLVTVWPNSASFSPTSWAWWTTGIWIGDRHTNYQPCGSICAFEMTDGTWVRGHPAVTLLDLHVVWIVRQLYLRRIGRWPGRQFLHTAHERLTEQEPAEFCGCDSGREYCQCCRDRDRAIDPVARLDEHRRFRGGVGRRRPPPVLLHWLFGDRERAPAAGEVCLPAWPTPRPRTSRAD